MGQTFVGGDGMNLFDLVAARKLSGGGGGGDVSVDALSVTENGTYSASSGHAYSPVTVSVPVGVFPSGTSSITANGIYDITNFASVDVNVSGGGGGDHDYEDAIIERSISGTYTNSRVTRLGINALYGCSSLTELSFPSVTIVAQAAFGNCYKLSRVYLPVASSIGASTFRGCSSLMAVYLLSTSVMTGAANMFSSTPMVNSTYTGSFGSIYVPASLVDSYKSQAYWSAYSSRITSYVE